MRFRFQAGAAGQAVRGVDRPLALRGGAVLAAAVLAMAGCGTVMPGAMVGGDRIGGGVSATATGSAWRSTRWSRPAS